MLAALCSSGHTDQHVHITLTLDKLLSNLQDSSGQGRMQQEVQTLALVVQDESLAQTWCQYLAVYMTYYL